MSDTIQTIGSTPVADDLEVRSEPFDATPDLVASNLSFGGARLELPGEMMSSMQRLWQDRDFTWPTMLSVIAITVSVEDAPDAEPAQRIRTRLSVLGTGFDPARPVQLSLTNAFGFPDASVDLAEATPDHSGFIGVDVTVLTQPRHNSDFTWSEDAQLALVARQNNADGATTHSAEQRALPPHVLWQWVR